MTTMRRRRCELNFKRKEFDKYAIIPIILGLILLVILPVYKYDVYCGHVSVDLKTSDVENITFEEIEARISDNYTVKHYYEPYDSNYKIYLRINPKHDKNIQITFTNDTSEEKIYIQGYRISSVYLYEGNTEYYYTQQDIVKHEIVKMLEILDLNVNKDQLKLSEPDDSTFYPLGPYIFIAIFFVGLPLAIYAIMLCIVWIKKHLRK